MTWQELGALGELVGATAGVALLGYIAYQIRQNSTALKLSARSTLASTRQASNEFWARFWSLIAQDPSLAGIWRRGRAGEPLDDDEVVRFEALLNVMFSYAEDAHTQWLMGTFDIDIFALGGELFSEILSSPVTRSWWDRDGRHSFSPEFCSAIDQLLTSDTDT